MSKTVIKYAKELISEHGKEYAIRVFESRIKSMGNPKNFEETCKLSGWEVAIQYIKGGNLSTYL